MSKYYYFTVRIKVEDEETYRSMANRGKGK